MARRDQRFASDGTDVVLNNVQSSLSILQAVEMPGASDADLIRGLQWEINSDINLQSDWNDAVRWFATINKVGDWAKNEKYHLALRTFTLNSFYVGFNQACRNLTSTEAARSFKYRNYFNLLLRAIKYVRGQPFVIGNSMLYRGCRFKLPNLVVGEKFLFKQFTSTSLSRQSALNFLGSYGTFFVVEGIRQGAIGSQTVIGLSNHSAFPSESEALTNPFHVFKITKIEGASSPITTVYLRSIS